MESPDKVTALLDAARTLAALGAPYALIGGVAVGIHSGVPRATLDTDLSRIISGGLQFSYALTEAKHINRAFSQMTISASFQLSLYAGDYR